MWSTTRSTPAVSDEPLRIEAFDSSIQGRRISVIGPPEVWLGVVATMAAEQIYRGRTILVLHEPAHGEGRAAAAPPLSLLRAKWDLVIRVKEGFEAHMLATYVENAPKPIRILWCSLGGRGVTGEIPRALWGRWTQGVTLIGGHTEGMVGGCEWDAIFFPPAHDRDKIERVLAARGGVAATAKFAKIRDGVSEITASGAALVWSCIDEADTRAGGLYWYDPKEYASSIQWSAAEVQDTLRAIADWAAGASGGH